MPSSRILIASNTLTGTQASVTFSSIPSTYTDLVLRCSTRLDQAVAGSWLDIYFNSDSSGSSTNYSSIRVTGNGSAAASAALSNDDQLKVVSGAQGTSDTTNTFTSVEIYIPNYRISQNKSIGAYAIRENNATAAGISATAGLWRNTAAITQIAIYPDNSTGNFVSGSSFFLYGLKNS